MTDEYADRIYEGVRRMVIWDEPCDDVFHRLEVNGIPAAKARQMYEKARAERMALIRAGSIQKAVAGLGLLLVGGGLLFGFSVGLGVVMRPVLVLGAVASVFGLWHFSKGLFYFFFAHARKGSLAEDD